LNKCLHVTQKFDRMGKSEGGAIPVLTQ